MEPSTTENPKRENRFTPNKLSVISTYLERSQALFHTHSRPIQVANVQEFFSLQMSYDVLWCFTSMSYHRHAENVLSKVDIACGQFVLYIVTVYPCSDGAPKDASGCHCVLLLCHLMYCHLPNISPWRLRRFTKSKSHLQQIPPVSFILPQLCLCTWRIQNHQTTCHRVCSFTHSASDHPSTPPPVVPTGRFRSPWPPLSTASTAAPAASSCSTTAVWYWPAELWQRCPTSGAERARRRQRLAPPAHCSGRNCTLWSEVREFHLFQNCIASWLNGSHYLLLVFVKITKTTN